MGQEEGRKIGRWEGGRPAAWQDGRMGGWEDERTGRKEAGGKKKDGERKKTKPYTTIPSRGFAPGKLPLDRPHQGAAMLPKATKSNGLSAPANLPVFPRGTYFWWKVIVES